MEVGHKAPEIRACETRGAPALIVFFETDCPTCRLAMPYLNALAAASAQVIGISQDDELATSDFCAQMSVAFPVIQDRDLTLSRAYDPMAVPCLFLLNAQGYVTKIQAGFDKEALNEIAAMLGLAPAAGDTDGAPARKPGCVSRHREPATEGETAPPLNLYAGHAARASRIELPDSADLFEYCMREFGDPLPVIPPAVERVERMLASTPLDPAEVIGLIPPCYGAATVEKIAANAVMAGCAPELMRVLIPLVRAACDERFNMHGVQATTHFAAPLILVNGPARKELGFVSGQNVFSNVARANSTLGRALQLILLQLGGARPDGIDMSALGNPGKFSYCIAENEEESPWEPFHTGSAVTLFAAEAPHGVSEHSARTARGVLKAISRALATVWSYRACLGFDALVVIGPEHARTIHRDGFSKQDVRQHLFENTGIPVREYLDEDAGEGTQLAALYRQVR
ncbi:MAG: TlpA family protein disulfide reductase, partial [Acidobacteria bacterium]|nr:TlpA family protein disulfide reductase [Acidobacteriota bacterium]